MKQCAKASKPIRLRTSSGTTLGPRDELLRESIRLHVAREPYAFKSPEQTWEEARRLAQSLHKDPEVVRKAIYNRRNFVNRKIQLALVKYEVLDPASPFIATVATCVQTITDNVIYFLVHHHDKISAAITKKTEVAHTA